jgi:hypothetical protein
VVIVDPAGPISGAAARALAEQELRRSEYHHDDPSVPTRVLDWIGRRLDSLVSGTASGSALLLLLVLLGGLIVFVVVRAGRPQRLARQRIDGLDPLAADGQLDHRRLAADYLKQGRFAEAQREWLRATIATIEARGVLDPRPGRTGAGIAREAGRALPAIAADLNAVIDAFDAVWFGRRAATVSDAVAARQVAEAARTAAVARMAEPAGSR